MLAHTPITFLGLAADAWTAIGTWIMAAGALGTLAVAWLAVRYAKGQLDSARDQLDMMQQTREDETRPYVVVDVQPSEADFHLVDLVVENIGRTPAYNVHLEFDPNIASSLPTTQPGFPVIADSVLINEGIKVMPPGRRIAALLDRHPDRLESDLPRRYDVTVTLDDSRGRAQEPQPYVLDLEQMSGLRHVVVRGPHDIAKGLESIERTVARLPDRWRSLSANDMRHDESVATSAAYQPAGDSPVELLAGSARLRQLVGNPLVARVVEGVPPLRGWLQRRRARDEAMLRSLADASEPLQP